MQARASGAWWFTERVPGMHVGCRITGLLPLLAGSIMGPVSAAAPDARCAMFGAAFSESTVTNIRLYGDRHGMIVYVVGCPEVDVGVRFGPGVWDDPAHAEFRAYF